MARGLAIALAAGVLLAGCTGKPEQVPPPAPPAEEPDDNDVGLTEKTGPELKAAYGVPAFARKEADSEIWRYDVGSCRIFFFLYPEGGELRLRRTETISPNSSEIVDTDCINAFVRTAKRP